MGLHNPLPSSLRSETTKAAKILSSFVDTRQAMQMTDVIPPAILTNAKGLAILTVLKAGFLFSGRIGSGIVIARLPDGSWSAPSAIATGGMGVGGQIGAELTDFVMILNSDAAVRTFASAGSITLGGNLSVAAGPIGRNAEASGTASHRGVAAVFSYSKTRGLFAGISLEGSVLVERKDANAKLYGRHISAKNLLMGDVPRPPGTQELYRILNSRVFSMNQSSSVDNMYNDFPVYGDEDDDIWNGQRDSGYKDHQISSSNKYTFDNDLDEIAADSQYKFRSSYSDKPYSGRATSSAFETSSREYSDCRPNSKYDRAMALYDFNAEQEGDLSFQKGDIINIMKKSETSNDWWNGKTGDREGIFPANYVKII